ncbi:MAG: AmmeMemoRadiSam system radical SAM enzyme [Calditrichaeota bacterium]|nr:MAG: AmmeMemoRadiSam system radical SAM enzyme [Calditrichota bacterium]
MPPISGSSTLSSKLDRLVQTGELFEQVDKETVRCYACGHYCLIKKGKRGICQIRFNHNGELKVPWGYVAALHNDPTEKKPFYHVFPGSSTMTFGMLGCDLHCPYCQNWDISQALRDSRAGYTPKEISPEQIVALAKQSHSRCIASSYNEPLITSEWAKAIFQLAKREGFTCLYVSNGNVTREVLEYLQQHVDGFNIDLKTMQDKNYRKLGAVLERILEGIRMTFQMGFWLEIVTLIVPGFNDSETEIREIARFIKSISPTIPWHVTAFHPDYKMTSPPPTPPRTIIRAAEIGYEEGLRYVYGGNLPGGVRQFENTYCPGCHKPVIERVGYRILRNVLHEGGFCPYCEMKIDGLLD